jgi:hypothetical protein
VLGDRQQRLVDDAGCAHLVLLSVTGEPVVQGLWRAVGFVVIHVALPGSFESIDIVELWPPDRGEVAGLVASEHLRRLFVKTIKKIR